MGNNKVNVLKVKVFAFLVSANLLFCAFLCCRTLEKDEVEFCAVRSSQKCNDEFVKEPTSIEDIGPQEGDALRKMCSGNIYYKPFPFRLHCFILFHRHQTKKKYKK